MTLNNLALSRSTIDRVTKRRNDQDWIDAAWKDPRTRVLVVHQGQALVRYESLVFLSPPDAPAGVRFLLGEDTDGTVYFGVSAPLPAAGPGVRAASLREVGAVLPDRDAVSLQQGDPLGLGVFTRPNQIYVSPNLADRHPCRPQPADELDPRPHRR